MFREAGTPVTWPNPQFVPENQRQNGGWYYNPATNRVDRWWSSGSPEPQQQSQPQQNQSQAPVTAESIIEPVRDKLKEQITFLKDFIDKNPLGFDEVLARQMANEKYKPYYQEVLQDFVEPLQTRIARSTGDEQRLLSELVRQKGVGSREITDLTEQAVNRSREGFAGTGLLGSGIEAGVTGRQEIAGQNKLSDFLAGNKFQQESVMQEQQRAREDAQKAIAQKERDIFGRGRDFETAVAKDTEYQRGTALRQRGLSTINAITERFGSPLPDIPNYLNLYNT